MKKIIYLLFISVFFIVDSHGQELSADSEQEEVNGLMIRADIITPGLTLEKNLVKNFYLRFGAKLGFSYSKLSYYEGSYNEQSQVELDFYPIFFIEPRIYSKNIYQKAENMDSEYSGAMYLSLPVYYIDSTPVVTAMIGKQIVFWKRWYLDLGVGTLIIPRIPEGKIGRNTVINLGFGLFIL